MKINRNVKLSLKKNYSVLIMFKLLLIKAILMKKLR